MIMPTIGRKVWFWPHTTDNRRIVGPGQPFDATVVMVVDKNRVTLDVCDHHGSHFVVGNAYLYQGEDDPDPAHRQRPIEDFAEWMPYQKKVAGGEIAPTLHAAKADAVTSNTKQHNRA